MRAYSMCAWQMLSPIHILSRPTSAPKAIWALYEDVTSWPSWDAEAEFITRDGPFQAGTTGTMKFVGQEPATKVLTTERGIPAIPAVQKEVAPLLDPQAKIALDFTESITSELVPPPQVTPANATGLSTEFIPIGTEVLFGKTSPADGATKVLSIIQSMK